MMTHFNTSTTSSFTYEDMVKQADQIKKWNSIITNPDRILVLKMSLERFFCLLEEQGVKRSSDGRYFDSNLTVLEIVEEGGYVFVGTPEQFRKAREQSGSLAAALGVSETIRGPKSLGDPITSMPPWLTNWV